MSAQNDIKRITTTQIRSMKGGTPVVSLTAYTTNVAKFLDPHCDFLLVGDSLGMVLYGLESTVGVTLDMMITHGNAVMRGAKRACIVVDMPFGTYQESPQQAFRNAARIMIETGCSAIKLEGGEEMAETVAFLTARGVPVLGHVGLMPQSVHTLGGFKAQGRDYAEAQRIRRDAESIATAGAFAIVVEGTLETLAREITEVIDIPTIGIGASPACDGQILVSEDVMGLFSDFTPKFVKRYATLGAQIEEAGRLYAEDVRARRFPAAEHTFGARPKGVASAKGAGKAKAPAKKTGAKKKAS